MKATIIRSDLRVAIKHDAQDTTRDRADFDAERMEIRDGFVWWRVGAVIDHPDCWQLVLLGNAVPADDDCDRRCGNWRERRAEVLHARERLAKGIRPEDFERYDAGELLGYDPATGRDILPEHMTPEQEGDEIDW